MKRVNLIRHLVAHGCYLHRDGSRHDWWRNPEGGQGTVPRHNEIKDILARQIRRQTFHCAAARIALSALSPSAIIFE